MDSQQHHPDLGGGAGRVNETVELVRENEELRAAMLRLQEQVASLAARQSEVQPPVRPSPLEGAQGPQSSLNDWILRQQLKKYAIPKFLGVINHETVLWWTEAVTHFALLAGLDNNATITAAWTAVAPEVLVWFKTMLETDYNYKFVAAAMDYPFLWEEIKEKFVHRYSPAFAVESVWNSLEGLKRGTGPGALQEFNTKFLELARLAGKNRQNTVRGDRLYTIYVKKMSTRERDILSAIAISAHRSNKVITLDDAMAVTDDQAVTHSLAVGGTGTSNITPLTPTFTSSSHPTAPAPMDLSVMASNPIPGTRRDRNICSRCGGRGHWSASCGTRPDWKEGDPVSGYRGRSGVSRGPRSFGERRRGRSGAVHMLEEDVEGDTEGANAVNAANHELVNSHLLSKN